VQLLISLASKSNPTFAVSFTSGDGIAGDFSVGGGIALLSNLSRGEF